MFVDHVYTCPFIYILQECPVHWDDNQANMTLDLRRSLESEWLSGGRQPLSTGIKLLVERRGLSVPFSRACSTNTTGRAQYRCLDGFNQE